MEFRSDAIENKLAWERTPHGYVAFATLAKIGHPLNYQESEKSRQEYVASFSEDSIASIRGMPICLGHPESGTYQGNKSGVAVGHFLQEVLITDSGELLAPVTVTDSRGIALIEKCLANGKSPEISPAYWVESVQCDSAGMYQQHRGRYDHAALLEPGQGRGGSTIALRLDNLQKENMSQPETTATTAAAPAAVSSNADIDALKAQVEKLQGENLGLKTQLTAIGDTHITLDSVNDKLQTLAKIGKINLDSIDIKLSATDLRKQHIKSIKPDLNLTNASDDFVAGVFETLIGSTATPAAEAAVIAETGGIGTIGGSLTSDSVASAMIAATKQQLTGTRSDSAATNPIETAKQKRLQQIEQNSAPKK